MKLSRTVWQGIAMVLFLVALSWGACGMLFGAIPTEPTENMPFPESTDFWITRGLCIGPAFALLFLAYLAFMAGRRPTQSVHWSEIIATLGVAVGLMPIFLGLAILLQPASDDPAGDRIFAPLLCLLPGLFIVSLSGIFWALVARRR